MQLERAGNFIGRLVVNNFTTFADIHQLNALPPVLVNQPLLFSFGFLACETCLDDNGLWSAIFAEHPPPFAVMVAAGSCAIGSVSLLSHAYIKGLRIAFDVMCINAETA